MYVKICILVVVMLSCVFLFSNLSKLSIDTSIEGFLKKDDKVLEIYNTFLDTFGKNSLIVIAVQTQNIFDLGFLQKLAKFHQTIDEKVPHVDKIDSLYSARYTYGENEDLIIEKMSEYWPEKESDINGFKEKVLSNPLYHNTIINAEKNVVIFGIRTELYSKKGEGYLTDEEIKEAIIHLNIINKEFDLPLSFNIYMAGTPVASDIITSNMKKDMITFSGISFLMIVTILGVLFRRISAVVLPIFVVIVSLLSTLSFMAIFQIPLKLPTQIIPSFLLSVGICYSLHVLMIFFRNYDVREKKIDAIIKTAKHVKIVIFFTGLTTAIGIFSFSFANLSAVVEFGIFGALGVMLSTLYVIYLLLLLLAIFPIKPIEKLCNKEIDDTISTKFLWAISKFSILYKKKILFVTVILLGVSFYGIDKLLFSHDPLHWLPDHSHVRISTDMIDDSINGSASYEIVIDTGVKYGVYEPDFIQKIYTLQDRLNRIPDFGKTVSIIDALKETHKALYGGKDGHDIPQGKNGIAEELFLFELGAKSDLEKFVDDGYQNIRLSVRLPHTDNEESMSQYKIIDKLVKEIFPDTKAAVTGFSMLVVYSTNMLIESMVTSYLITGIVISLVILAFCKTYKLGVLAMIPNFTPIIMILGIMGIFQIPIDMFTLLIGSIAIGIAVDDTMHFLYHYHKYYGQEQSNDKAIYLTLQTSGKAMLFTTIILSGGFYIYMFSEMSSIVNFGLLTATTMILAFIGDVMLTPALVSTFYNPDKNDKVI